MTQEDFNQEVGYYIEDICKFTRSGDLSSAQIMVSGLRKLIAEQKKSKKLRPLNQTKDEREA